MYVTVQFEYCNYYLYVIVWVNAHVFETSNKYIFRLTFFSTINKNMPDYIKSSNLRYVTVLKLISSFYI